MKNYAISIIFIFISLIITPLLIIRGGTNESKAFDNVGQTTIETTSTNSNTKRTKNL